MNKFVDWNEDIVGTGLLELFQAEYHRCNIWPGYETEAHLKSDAEAVAVEMMDVSEALLNEARDEYFPTHNNVTILKANAIETVCAALKIISLCDKWEKRTLK